MATCYIPLEWTYSLLYYLLVFYLLNAQMPINSNQRSDRGIYWYQKLSDVVNDWHFLCLGVKKLLFWISLCLHTCFWHLGLSDVIIQGRWPEVYQNWLIFIDYYCTVIILKQRTKINSNVIQLKLWKISILNRYSAPPSMSELLW